MKRMLFVLTVLAVPSAVHAQDTPKVGVTMGYPSAVGILWHVADSVALRPEVTLTRSSGESNGNDLSPTVTTDGTTAVGVSIGALFYLGRKDAFRPYISPKFSYSRSSTSSAVNSNTILGPSTSESTLSAYAGAASVGGQYALGRRFGVFGEVGLAYTRTNTALTSTFTTTGFVLINGALTQTVRQQTLQSSARSNLLGTRTAVGVIVYF